MALIEVYVDGGCRQIPGASGIGEAACGAVIYINKKRQGEFARGLGKRTSNEAEYEAVLCGIMLCWSANLKDPIIYSDSTLVVNQVLNKYECTSPSLKPYLFTIQQIQKEFRFRLQHVSRNGVSEADTLVNLFLDTLLREMPIGKAKQTVVVPPPPI